MTTAAALVGDVQREILSGVRERKNKLLGALLAGATSMTFAYDITKGPTAVRAGDVVSVDLERFYVWSTADASNTATVEPGWDGTTQAIHANSTMTTTNSRCDQFACLDAVNKDLASLSSPVNGLFQAKTVALTYVPTVMGYDLTVSPDAIIEIRYQTAGPYKDEPLITRYSIARNQPTTVFASGTGLIIYKSGWPGLPIQVVYKAPFVSLVNLTDDVQTVSGLPATANDIPPLGAIERLWTPREMKRNFTDSQGEPRRAEEVTPGSVAASSRGTSALRQRRIMEEAARLSRMYPIRSRAV